MLLLSTRLGGDLDSVSYMQQSIPRIMKAVQFRVEIFDKMMVQR